jgi:pantoate--beta-alanine ligase
MIIVKTISELQTARSGLPTPVGLVPTMGFLHAGHLSLVEQARAECKSVVVSIFVNPTQFAPTEDLESYPRDIDRDLALIETAGADLVWMPTPDIMYPPDFQTWVTVDAVTQPLEGAQRLEHFRGVTTIVAKLFNGVQPSKAYFGQKDAQQAVVIQQMAHDLNFQIEIEICPIIRESDGLALSSRNSYLNSDQRQAALILSQTLMTAKSAYESGESDAEAFRQLMLKTIATEPLAKCQYVSIADHLTLNELESVDQDGLFSMAVYIGKTRLIDNYLLRNGTWQTGRRLPQGFEKS